MALVLSVAIRGVPREMAQAAGLSGSWGWGVVPASVLGNLRHGWGWHESKW